MLNLEKEETRVEVVRDEKQQPSSNQDLQRKMQLIFFNSSL